MGAGEVTCGLRMTSEERGWMGREHFWQMEQPRQNLRQDGAWTIQGSLREGQGVWDIVRKDKQVMRWEG